MWRSNKNFISPRRSRRVRIVSFPRSGVTAIKLAASAFSLEGEGWDEGEFIRAFPCFVSPHPSPLQRERGMALLNLMAVRATHGVVAESLHHRHFLRSSKD